VGASLIKKINCRDFDIFGDVELTAPPTPFSSGICLQGRRNSGRAGGG